MCSLQFLDVVGVSETDCPGVAVRNLLLYGNVESTLWHFVIFSGIPQMALQVLLPKSYSMQLVTQCTNARSTALAYGKSIRLVESYSYVHALPVFLPTGWTCFIQRQSLIKA